ncbi:hypothetical protein FNF29_03309 [Cafeteria roenbergensis]|uniref:Lysoplasmalogenase n=1 Tax=Cafeteria roenbergensis TaxID=33653 RepID=A0A5A8CMQ5_CAFRO|nr:hypothetical protein FNF29_03309 [Cafeteria roenbergensis]|eukprot:KAA0153121.1 hypothetical protein FNF29_03309 [Cafeteria roenbergensis]
MASGGIAHGLAAFAVICGMAGYFALGVLVPTTDASMQYRLLLAMLKAGPVALLGVWTLVAGNCARPAKGSHVPVSVPLAGVGLLLGCLGDTALELQRQAMPKLFLAGLGFFLLSHVAYVAAFASDSRLGFLRTPRAAVGFIFYSSVAAALLSIMLPLKEPELTAPVIVYASTIGVMGVLSVAWWPSRSESLADGGRRSYLLGVFGAAFFLLSDSILAYNKFVDPIPHAHTLTMATYYAAQGLIAMAALSRLADAQQKSKDE